jgi:hypothetical protein
VLIVAIIVASLLAASSAIAPMQSSPAPTPTRFVGETFSYSAHAVMSQSIAGNDAFGRPINQTSAPTNVKLHESISITKATAQDLTMHRLGTITAVVVGAKPVTKSGQGWTIVNNSGIVVHDSGKLGGLFLLPLPFLANGSMKDGAELAVGDSWTGELGTKLYGMTARPRLKFTVTAERIVSDIKVYTIEATGSVRMKEPVMTAAGEPLGYATGTADITAHLEYDRDNRRLVSMQAELNDTLHYSGPTKHISGHVKDHQKCEVSLDLSSVAGGLHDDVSTDPLSGPQP